MKLLVNAEFEIEITEEDKQELAAAVAEILSAKDDNGDISDEPDNSKELLEISLTQSVLGDLPGGWEYHPDGGIHWTKGNLYEKPGQAVIAVDLYSPQAGRYQLFADSEAAENPAKKHLNNDTFFKFEDLDGRFGDWFKAYMYPRSGNFSDGLRAEFSKDDHQQIKVDLPKGLVRLLIAPRSVHHRLERIRIVPLFDLGAGNNDTQPGNKSKLGPKGFICITDDFRPDRDGGHSAALDKMIIDYFGLENQMMYVCGTYAPDSKHEYHDPAKVLNAVFGTGNWYNAHTNHDEVVQIAAQIFDEKIADGGHVWVADGGPMSFTANVLREMKQDTKSVTVVQHSNWNKNQDRAAEQYIKKVGNYRKIDDGNLANSTADLNSKLDVAVINRLKALPVHGDGWKAGFEYYPPNKRVDASDAVAVIEICDPDAASIKNWDDCINRYAKD